MGAAGGHRPPFSHANTEANSVSPRRKVLARAPSLYFQRVFRHHAEAFTPRLHSLYLLLLAHFVRLKGIR